MPRGMHGNSQEKSKDFVGAMKRLFKELKNFRVLIYVALVLASISAILSIVAPSKLSSMTDEITNGLIVNRENMEEIHNYFRTDNVTILSGDFVEATRNAREGDFVYFDPPYDTWEDKESFTAYSKFDFNKEDQRRLAECFKDLTDRGVKCMLSNHNTAFINELYDIIGG